MKHIGRYKRSVCRFRTYSAPSGPSGTPEMKRSFSSSPAMAIGSYGSSLPPANRTRRIGLSMKDFTGDVIRASTFCKFAWAVRPPERFTVPARRDGFLAADVGGYGPLPLPSGVRSSLRVR